MNVPSPHPQLYVSTFNSPLIFGACLYILFFVIFRGDACMSCPIFLSFKISKFFSKKNESTFSWIRPATLAIWKSKLHKPYFLFETISSQLLFYGNYQKKNTLVDSQPIKTKNTILKYHTKNTIPVFKNEYNITYSNTQCRS